MNTIAIDTHKTIMKLKQKGYSEEQAEGFVEALTESELVTTSYLDDKVKELRGEIREVRSDLTIKLYSVLLVHGLVIVATILTVAKSL